MHRWRTTRRLLGLALVGVLAVAAAGCDGYDSAHARGSTRIALVGDSNMELYKGRWSDARGLGPLGPRIINARAAWTLASPGGWFGSIRPRPAVAVIGLGAGNAIDGSWTVGDEVQLYRQMEQLRDVACIVLVTMASPNAQGRPPSAAVRRAQAAGNGYFRSLDRAERRVVVADWSAAARSADQTIWILGGGAVDGHHVNQYGHELMESTVVSAIARCP